MCSTWRTRGIAAIAASVTAFFAAGDLTLPFLFLSAAWFFQRTDDAVRILALLPAGLVLAMGGDAEFSWFFALSTLLGAISSGSRLSRLFFFLSAAVLFIRGDINFLLPAAMLPMTLLDRGHFRAAAAAGAVALQLLLFGIPPGGGAVHIHENLMGEELSWTVPATLDLSRNSMILQGGTGSRVELGISCGGVRDRAPVASVTSGDAEYAVYPGDTLLEIPAARFPVRIELIRDWKPFSHPTLHLRSGRGYP